MKAEKKTYNDDNTSYEFDEYYITKSALNQLYKKYYNSFIAYEKLTILGNIGMTITKHFSELIKNNYGYKTRTT